MTVSMIVARDRNGGIGSKNALMWRLRSDLRFFKETTMGHSIIMGRKTFESLPHALPERKNIVVTRDKDFFAPDVTVAFTPEQALSEAGDGEAFVIGGEQIYKLFFPLCNRLYITEVDAVFPQADAFFPDFNKSDYTATELGGGEENGLGFKRIIYTPTEKNDA